MLFGLLLVGHAAYSSTKMGAAASYSEELTKNIFRGREDPLHANGLLSTHFPLGYSLDCCRLFFPSHGVPFHSREMRGAVFFPTASAAGNTGNGREIEGVSLSLPLMQANTQRGEEDFSGDAFPFLAPPLPPSGVHNVIPLSLPPAWD